jgi:hypothetical protein
MSEWRDFPLSNSIARANYDEDRRELTIEFRRMTGKPYTYQNVDSGCYMGLCEADSAGRFYRANIRGRYDHYR